MDPGRTSLDRAEWLQQRKRVNSALAESHRHVPQGRRSIHTEVHTGAAHQASILPRAEFVRLSILYNDSGTNRLHVTEYFDTPSNSVLHRF